MHPREISTSEAVLEASNSRPTARKSSSKRAFSADTCDQKFMPEEKGGKAPELSKRRNIIVIADEAHPQPIRLDRRARAQSPRLAPERRRKSEG